ncbi:hypothetical protein [Microbulbifer thermotolerans]|uniref:Lipoprotein n=1 Tax=Microbulbifer thermotolerans TaxID=252514 RepID=A0AB35HWC6_MICTH|nr:hypothetical protein [Microbulbifer thermotolerans]MCX2801111.1 hypothetical protein [Microbulbifer thermotolerans]MCX2831260.1 hypothetical protein [Microbulbifer thermotolerans]
MRRIFQPLVFISLLFIGACAQQSALEERAQNADADGLLPRESGLDEVAAVFALDLSGAAVYVEPVEIEYTKRFKTGPGTARARDYELDESDRQKLNALLAQTFSEKFLAPRGSRLVDDPAEADYRLQLRLENFSLAAPLDPTATWVWRVYTDQSAYGVLVGSLYDSDGNPVMRFRDRRDIGDNFVAGPGRFERFNSVTFWGDMRIDMRRAFASLDKSL